MSREILTEEERKRIAAAVGKAEKNTSGEIATAVIRESSDYAVYELAASLGAGILWFLVLLLFYPRVEAAVSGLFWNAPAWYVTAFYGLSTLVVTGLVYFFSNLPVLDRRIVPKRIMHREVRSRALRHFTESGVYATRDHTGILIFVSLLERRVEILADSGLSEKIPQSDWDSIVGDLTDHIRRGELAEGLVRSVEACGTRLAKHFPIKKDDTNELSDSVDILES